MHSICFSLSNEHPSYHTYIIYRPQPIGIHEMAPKIKLGQSSNDKQDTECMNLCSGNAATLNDKSPKRSERSSCCSCNGFQGGIILNPEPLTLLLPPREPLPLFPRLPVLSADLLLYPLLLLLRQDPPFPLYLLRPGVWALDGLVSVNVDFTRETGFVSHGEL